MARKWNLRIAVGVAAVAIGSLAGVAPAAFAAGPVTAVSVSANPFGPGVPSVYTVEFTTSSTGALAAGTGTITITDGGGVLPSTASDYIIDSAGHSAAASGISGSGGSVTINTPTSVVTIGALKPVIITINGITTPAAATYTATVATSSDTTPVSTNYTIGTATQVVAYGGNNQSAGPNATFPLRLGAHIRDVNNLNVDEAGVQVTFTVVPGVGGQAGTFANGLGATTVSTDGTGLATSTFLTANGTSGSFTVSATATVGVNPLTPATFTFTISPPVAPLAPTIGTATAGNASATVTWTPPGLPGGVPTSYTVTSSPGTITATAGLGATSAMVTGLTNGVSYTFTVTATNTGGTSGPSGSSNAVTPVAPPPPPPPPPPSPPTGNGNLAAPVTGMASLPNGSGYWLTDAAGGVSAHGNAVNYGSMAGHVLNAPVNHIVATPDGKGYWLVAADGGTFTFGDAGFYGSTGNIVLNAPVVDIAPTQTGKGYWLVASDGGIFSFGDAQFHGSMGGKPLNKPVVGMSAGPNGGYWLVATDGGIFSFGEPFYGSTGNIVLNKPVNGMAVTASGHGYWFVASDGGIFSFGDAQFHGSTGNLILNAPIMGMAASLPTGGYWMVGSDGGIFAFGAPFFGAD